MLRRVCGTLKNNCAQKKAPKGTGESLFTPQADWQDPGSYGIGCAVKKESRTL